MKSKGYVLAVLVASGALLGFAGYLTLAPYRTMKNFGEALAARDSVAISDCVDFPKLRDSVKGQFEKNVSARSKSLFADDPIASLAAGLATNLSDSVVDSLVTPQGLEKLLAGERFMATVGGSAGNPATLDPETLAKARYSYRSFSEFTVTLEPKPGVSVEILLERAGLNWKITGLRLPE